MLETRENVPLISELTFKRSELRFQPTRRITLYPAGHPVPGTFRLDRLNPRPAMNSNSHKAYSYAFEPVYTWMRHSYKCTGLIQIQIFPRMTAQPVLEGTHYPSLTGGHPDSSCTDISIVGLHVKVYGLEEIEGSNLPIAAVVSRSDSSQNCYII